MSRKQKLELTWIGKEDYARPEPRVLLEDHSLSHLPNEQKSGLFDNKIIHGDNLLALKALEASFSSKIKCIYIDPPYNTWSAISHYDDGVEHSLWLSLMRERLLLLRKLLRRDGSIWISIDDNECHYLKVVLDEVFGRANFVGTIIWQKKYAPSNDAIWFSDTHDYIIVYAFDKQIWRPNPLPRTEEQERLYKNPDKDARGAWMSDNYTCAKNADERPNLYYAISNPNTGEEIWPKRTRVWAFERTTHERHVAEGRIWWGAEGTGKTPRLKKYLRELKKDGRVTATIWPYEEVGHTQDAKREAHSLMPSDPFPTPKPEKLLARIVHIATAPGDWVLDSFAGSGTTGAVAHKLGRQWIMIEQGAHAITHAAPRLKNVVDGVDQLGITGSSGWTSGGGYRFFYLAPSLLEHDRWGNWVISKKYDPIMLAEAMCKHMAFTYAPSLSALEYWNHGFSSERDFIYVTTQALTHSMLKGLCHDVGPDRHLLICCKAFSGKTDEFANLSVRRIPQTVLANCEWGRDDYSLRVANILQADDTGDDSPAPEEATPPRRARQKATNGTAPDLFSAPAETEA